MILDLAVHLTPFCLSLFLLDYKKKYLLVESLVLSLKELAVVHAVATALTSLKLNGGQGNLV